MAAQTRAAMPETGRESASAMTLEVSGTNTRMLVYFDMNARWRCLRPDVSGDILSRAKIKIRGLRPLVGSKLERPACNCKSGAEMFDT